MFRPDPRYFKYGYGSDQETRIWIRNPDYLYDCFSYLAISIFLYLSLSFSFYRLVQMAMSTKFFWIDDIYVTGYLGTSVFGFHKDSSHKGLLPYDSSHGTPPDRDSSQTGLLPENSSRNRIPPEMGFLPPKKFPPVL